MFVLAAAALIVTAVLGSAWITGQFTTPAVDRTDGYVSELAARDQPWTRLFRVSDALSGLACLAGVALVPRVAREWPGWLALAAFGLLVLAAGIFPLDCAALSDPLCGRRGTSPGHLAHTLARVLGTLAVLAAMALLSERWRSRVSWLFTWLTVAATLFTVVAVAAGHGAGLAHRAQLTMIAVWLVYVALRLLILDGDDPNAEAGPRIALGRMGGVGGARVRADDAPRWNAAERTWRAPDGVTGAWTGPTGDAGAWTGSAGDAGSRAGPAGEAGAWAGSDGGTGRGAEVVGGGGRPHVVVQGAGPTVLITAGSAGAWFHWEAVAALLRAAHRVIRFDRPGLGLSPGPPAPPTLYAEVARLAALSPAHPEQVTVIAHGVACWHAEAFARLHPLRLAKLVLVAPACAGEGRPRAAARAAGRWLPALGGTWGATALARVAGPAAHRLLTGLPDPYGVYAMGKVPAAVAGEWLARRDMAADLRKLRTAQPFPDVPVTVISTAGGAGCRRALASELGAEHVRLPGYGRRLQLSSPQAVADAAATRPNT
ncbi:alpha/beta fold hydrolase [Nonomuraea sp. NPDC050404]|uniref:alpha/beta fold hydrolase n=1 Tax=Nonomuraea sp. NPDC050404 TaxID=3155783 RepID=UPI00340E749B